GALALAVLLAGGSVGWAVRDRSARNDKLNDGVEMAVQGAGAARERALGDTDNPYRWEVELVAARSALQRGEELAAQGQAALDRGLDARLKALRSSLDADEQDRVFVARFDEIMRGILAWDARRSRFK